MRVIKFLMTETSIFKMLTKSEDVLIRIVYSYLIG